MLSDIFAAGLDSSSGGDLRQYLVHRRVGRLFVNKFPTTIWLEPNESRRVLTRGTRVRRTYDLLSADRVFVGP